MNCLGIKCIRFNRAASDLAVVGILLAAVSATRAAIIVDDSWADAGRNNGVDASDTDWWTSTSNQAIEVSAGSMGLVTGSSGRGIHGTFTPQTLSVGDTLKATFTFTTPATVGTNAQAALRIGLFDTLGKAGLAADLSASSGTPNHIYDDLPGYMMDYDVNFATANIQFREHNVFVPPAGSGQLMAQTGDYTSLTSGGAVYTIAASTSYTGVLSITKTAIGLDLTGSLSQGSTLLSSATSSDSSASTSSFGMLAFHANSNIFGSSNTPNTANNGIDFTNIQIEYIPIPEPATLALFGMAGLHLIAQTIRRRVR